MSVNIPNLLTWLRLFCIPIIVGVYFTPKGWLTPYEQNLIATIVFVGAAITDWFDGWLARKLNQTSAFGAFLDPVADKLMVSAALIMLVEQNATNTLIAFIIIGREIAISALREWMAKIGAAKSVAVSFVGKLKTAAQMVAIPLLLYKAPLLGVDTLRVGQVLILLAAVLTLWSMAYYLKKAWPELSARS